METQAESIGVTVITMPDGAVIKNTSRQGQETVTEVLTVRPTPEQAVEP